MIFDLIPHKIIKCKLKLGHMFSNLAHKLDFVSIGHLNYANCAPEGSSSKLAIKRHTEWSMCRARASFNGKTTSSLNQFNKKKEVRFFWKPVQNSFISVMDGCFLRNFHFLQLNINQVHTHWLGFFSFFFNNYYLLQLSFNQWWPILHLPFFSCVFLRNFI